VAFSDASFIRRTSPSLLRQYFARKDIVVGEEVAWDTPGTKLREALIEWMAKQPGQVRVVITLDWERVSELSDELGQDAILRAFRDDRDEIIQQFKSLKGGKDRALWLFLNKLRDFQRAEEIAFARYYRNNKRHWDGFIGPLQATVTDDPHWRSAFSAAVCGYYTAVDGSGAHIEIEVFQHVDKGVSQVTMYLSGLPQVDLEFESGKLTPRERQLANEGAILYDPTDGAIDIVAPGGSRARKAVAAYFAEHMLQADEPLNGITLREYDLSSLKKPRHFEVDEADRIHHVEVRMLRLEPVDGEGGRLTVETTPGQTASLFQRLGDWMGGEVAAPDGFDVTRARLAVCFMAARGTQPGRSCTFEIAEPNGCTLKDHKSTERLILEKYLEKWNLSVSAQADDAADDQR
jgi:hypothetical protein